MAISLIACRGQAPVSALIGLIISLRSVPPSDTAVDQIVAEIGPDRILAALDRATQPQLPAE